MSKIYEINLSYKNNTNQIKSKIIKISKNVTAIEDKNLKKVALKIIKMYVIANVIIVLNSALSFAELYLYNWNILGSKYPSLFLRYMFISYILL